MKVGRGIAADADVGDVSGSTRVFVFAEPKVADVVEEDTAAMSVDVNAFRIGPDFAGTEARGQKLCGRSRIHAQDSVRGSGESRKVWNAAIIKRFARRACGVDP